MNIKAVELENIPYKQGLKILEVKLLEYNIIYVVNVTAQLFDYSCFFNFFVVCSPVCICEQYQRVR